jgi:predicted DNA repair protein MutK
VAAIAKVAAASVDDIVGAAAKAGAKAAGVVIDDTAVTPTYATGFAAERELPIIWRIAMGSLRNKLLILLPVALLLAAFLPGAIVPLLTFGGAYLCFEGAEKVFHALAPHADPGVEEDFANSDPTRLEKEKVAGAIKTDFILSAEIMTIALGAIPDSTFWIEAVTLAIVGVAITVLVYGSVAFIVKMDDIGLYMARHGRLSLTRALGRGLVAGMPPLLSLLSTVGTAAMLWVGGSMIVHGAEVFGLAAPAHLFEAWAEAASHAAPMAQDLIGWAVKATLDGILGLILGLALIPLVTRVIGPAIAFVTGKKSAGH